jgi:hypothetical protein
MTNLLLTYNEKVIYLISCIDHRASVAYLSYLSKRGTNQSLMRWDVTRRDQTFLFSTFCPFSAAINSIVRQML